MQKPTLYELNPSQEVEKLQSTYTLYKRVINILTSATVDKSVDLELMKKALNLLVKRNDCLRIRFVKKGLKLMQYFLPEFEYNNIPYVEFKTKEEQEQFVLKIRKTAIKYKKGVVFEPYFCKTYDGKFMLFIKLCHMILDLYGLNVIYADLFAIYDALENGTELPEAPGSFEEIVKKDLKQKHNKEVHKKNREFFVENLSTQPEPSYVGIHGPNLPLWQKRTKKGKKSMKMFFLHNDTQGFLHKIDKEIVDKAFLYCNENKCTISHFFCFAMMLTLAKINGSPTNVLPIDLCNCRGTLAERKCAGTKVQSVVRNMPIDYEKTFKHSMDKFNDEQNNLYRYVNFSDQEFEMLHHKVYHSSLMTTYYSASFSFVPFKKPKGVDIQIYSNGKCMLPAYVSFMWDADTNQIDMAYDCQTKLINQTDVEQFHQKFLSLIRQVLENNYIRLKEIEV